MVRLHLSWLVTIVVMMTVVPSIRADCAAVHPKCYYRNLGISCNDLGHISQVPKISHSGSVCLGLKITGNTTLSTIQTGAFNGLKVGTLILTSIGITAIQSGAFSDLSDTLEHLYLNDNELKTLPEDSFDGLGQLMALYLGKNNLKTLPDDIFNDLPHLRLLFLGSNGLKTLKTAWFRHLTNLQYIDLRKNEFETIPENAFEGLNHLRGLWLSQNRLKTLSYALVQNKPNLDSLALYGNPLACDCRLAWVRTMADKLRGFTPLCASPPLIKGTRVVAYDISMCAATSTETGMS